MIKLRELIKESAWDREFGEPLPTLSDVMEKHDSCCENCAEGNPCCESVNEDAKDVMRAKKLQKQIQGDESRLRLHMYELAERMQAHTVNFSVPRRINKIISEKCNKIYERNDVISKEDEII